MSDGSLPVACSAPQMPEQVVVELEREPERPAEGAVAGDHLVVVGGEQRAGLDRGGDQGGGLAADHVEVQLDRHQLVVTRSSQMSMYWPSHSATHVSS